MKKNEYNRGYERHCSQILEPGTTSESKEGLYPGEHLPVDHPRVVRRDYNCGPNLWPKSLGEEFEKVCTEYWCAMRRPYRQFTLHPLPPTRTTSPLDRGIGAHRDFGCITLLIQDSVRGLQVFDTTTNSWVDVKPVPGAYVMNLGNLTMKWTNGRYMSNLYRVMNFSKRDRYSIPFFFSGNPNYGFDVLPGCEA
ncbi:related to isopenicillin N synthase and related dioxygenases [Phialocephala subalpina]|uniref:Related to isopenicillin N synthase and related dioxygenases n=1 Tax=Phialocephala subalpina TaxID=576137 RepID=A0A1L7X156_9HELO|nr:related to isopenicillin N synthase and related dioxygenases [Phialocephala subalpina]